MRLSFDVENPVYLEALTHSSYIKEHPEEGAHNEVLEFIGDAVLQLCVTTVLVELYPNFREGDLTRMRHQLVDTKTLASWRVIDPENTSDSGWEERDGSETKTEYWQMRSRHYEAVYRLDGLDRCQQVVHHHFSEKANSRCSAPKTAFDGMVSANI